MRVFTLALSSALGLILSCGGETGTVADNGHGAAAGQSSTGSGSGGSASGGASAAWSTGGNAGTGGLLELDPPPVNGSCSLATLTNDCSPSPEPRYYYDPATRSCVDDSEPPCAPSAPFATQQHCEYRCGIIGPDPSCPVTYGAAAGQACSAEGITCNYGSNNCLCQVVGHHECAVDDPRCGTALGAWPTEATNGCEDDTCTMSDRLVLVLFNLCTCTGGTWQCRADL